MTDFITSDPKFAVSLALTIISIILAIIFYNRSKNIKFPCYSRSGRMLIDPKLIKRNPIKVTFNDEPVDTLSVTHIAFWNNGRTTINRDDLTISDLLRIIAKDGCNILAADVIVTNRPANNFQATLQRQENTVITDFDFIDYKNGAVVRLYHTGENIQDIDILGTIKGTNGILNVDKVGQYFAGLLERFDDEFKERLFRLIPNRLLNLVEEAQARHFVLYVLVFFPLSIVLAPFIFVYMVVGVLLVLAMMLSFIFGGGRYSLPKELYSIMRYG